MLGQVGRLVAPPVMAVVGYFSFSVIPGLAQLFTPFTSTMSVIIILLEVARFLLGIVSPERDVP